MGRQQRRNGDNAHALDRRSFLKLSAGGDASLALLGVGTQLAGCSQQTASVADGYRWLTNADLSFIKVLIRGIAGPALATAGNDADTLVNEGTSRADLCPDAHAAPAQKQGPQLFDHLQSSPVRRLDGGVSQPGRTDLGQGKTEVDRV